MKNKKITKILWLMVLISSICSVIYMTLAYSKFLFHSDCAGYLFLAKEQLKQGKMFPDRFHYTTEIFGISPNLLMIPFLTFLENDYLIHEMGTICYTLLIVVAIFVLFHKEKKMALLFSILYLMPISSTYVDMLFYQGAYDYCVLFMILSLIAIRYLYECVHSTDKKRWILGLSFYFVILFLGDLTSLRNFLLFLIPLIFTYATVIYLKEGGNPFDWVKEKKLLALLGATILCLGICFLHYKYLCAKVGFDGVMTSNGFIEPTVLFKQSGETMGDVLKLFGIHKTDRMISASSIYACVMLVYFVITSVILPLSILISFKKIENQLYRFCVIYLLWSNVLTFFMMIFFGLSSGRYFITVYIGNLLMEVPYLFWLCKEKGKMFWKWPILLPILGAMMVHGAYYVNASAKYGKVAKGDLINPVVQDSVVDLLKTKNIKYGYATFWYAYVTMIAGNSEIDIVAYDQGNPMMPYFFDMNKKENIQYYAISEDAYDVDTHKGPCFILVAEDEQIPDIYYQMAAEIVDVDTNTVLIYDQNIHLYPELREQEG